MEQFATRYYAKKVNNVLIYVLVMYSNWKEQIIYTRKNTYNADTGETTSITTNLVENNIYIYDYFSELEKNGYKYIG